jgi:hypothetical protein
MQEAAPVVKDPQRVADPSTLRRCHLDSSQPPFSWLRRTIAALNQWLLGRRFLHHGLLPLGWPTLFPFLARYWPLRL